MSYRTKGFVPRLRFEKGQPHATPSGRLLFEPAHQGRPLGFVQVSGNQPIDLPDVVQWAWREQMIVAHFA
jgi:hypothetical protein